MARGVETLTMLVEHLMRHVLSHDLGSTTWRKILHTNLELVQGFVESYGTHMKLDGAIIGHYLAMDDFRHVNAGLQLLALCLRQGVRFKEAGEKEKLVGQLVGKLSHRRQYVYVAACEALALALRAPGVSGGEQKEVALKALKDMYNGSEDRFVIAVHRVAAGARRKGEGAGVACTGFPELSTHFENQMLQVLRGRSCKAETKVRALDVLALRANELLKREKVHEPRKSAGGAGAGMADSLSLAMSDEDDMGFEAETTAEVGGASLAERRTDAIAIPTTLYQHFIPLLQTRDKGVQLMAMKLLYILVDNAAYLDRPYRSARGSSKEGWFTAVFWREHMHRDLLSAMCLNCRAHRDVQGWDGKDKGRLLKKTGDFPNKTNNTRTLG